MMMMMMMMMMMGYPSRMTSLTLLSVSFQLPVSLNIGHPLNSTGWASSPDWYRGFLKRATPKWSTLNHFNRILHYKASILGIPHFSRPPHDYLLGIPVPWSPPSASASSPLSVAERQHILGGAGIVKPHWRVHLGICLPSGKLTVCCGKSPFFIGKSTISMSNT